MLPGIWYTRVAAWIGKIDDLEREKSPAVRQRPVRLWKDGGEFRSSKEERKWDGKEKWESFAPRADQNCSFWANSVKTKPRA